MKASQQRQPAQQSCPFRAGGIRREKQKIPISHGTRPNVTCSVPSLTQAARLAPLDQSQKRAWKSGYFTKQLLHFQQEHLSPQRESRAKRGPFSGTDIERTASRPVSGRPAQQSSLPNASARIERRLPRSRKGNDCYAGCFWAEDSRPFKEWH